MKILAIDTATEACSVALYNSDCKRVGEQSDNPQPFELSKCTSIFEVCPQKHSQQILPMIESLLSKNGVKVTEIDAIAYARGPGSFTGVRIAASTVQGLALGVNIPVVQVSTLAVMAQQSFCEFNSEYVISAIDARMDEVYLAFYQLDIDSQTMQILGQERVVSPQDAVSLIYNQKTTNKEFAYVGTGFVTYNDFFAKETNHFMPVIKYPDAKYILPLAYEALRRGQALRVENVQPVYVRDTVTWKKLPNKV